MYDLKLYIWEGFCPSYTGGLAFAVASSESQARKLVGLEYLDGCAEPSGWGTLTIHPLNTTIARCVSGGR